MSNIEKEIKILDINVGQIKKKLESLGAVLKNDGIQKIYVYDLPSIFSRYFDCIMQLSKCSKPYDIDICKNKLKELLVEIDNLITDEQRLTIAKAIGQEQLNSILMIGDPIKLKEVLTTPQIIEIIKTLGINPNKWVRLRETNGKTTITIKHILNQRLQANLGTKMQPVLETEMEVPSINSGNALLEQLGFSFRNYQEKKRTTYILDGTEIDIDSWPLIPPYIEIEGKSDSQINDMVNRLGLVNKEQVSCNTAEVYKKYGIDLYKFRELRFKEKERDMDYR